MKHIIYIIALMLSIKAFGQDNITIGNELGVLEANIETYKEAIVIYNKDGSEWMKFDFNYEERMTDKHNYKEGDIKKLFHWNNEFDPYTFSFDYALAMFICIGIEGDRYKVIVNKKTGLEKYIKKDHFWILRNWQNHILKSVCSIDFDSKTNPLKNALKENSQSIPIKANIDPAISPLMIKGDWLKIKYTENDIDKTGWIKWRKGNKIIISLYYIL